MQLVGNKWDEILEEEYHKDYFKKIVLYINKAYKERPIYPPKSYILRALSLTDYDNVKVVILGQDPYHGTGEANGLAFAVNPGVKLPPSLKNIYKNNKEYLHEFENNILPDGIIEERGTGYVIDCLKSAFKIIRESNSYEDAIKKSIALGNDTDTTAAVVGGLAGIIYGFENIPTRWYEEIRGKEKILELIDKIHFEDI